MRRLNLILLLSAVTVALALSLIHLFTPVIVQHVLVEGVERGDDAPVLLYPADVRRHRTRCV